MATETKIKRSTALHCTPKELEAILVAAEWEHRNLSNFITVAALERAASTCPGESHEETPRG